MFEIIITEEEIKEQVKVLANKIKKDYEGKTLILIGILKGSFVFAADLMRELDGIDCRIDFMSVSSYGLATKTSGVVKILKDLDVDIKDKDVLIIEDIIDSGLTLNYLLKLLTDRGPKTLKICTAFDKKEAHVLEVPVYHSCFEVPNEFLVGYGLDASEKHRNLKYVAKLIKE